MRRDGEGGEEWHNQGEGSLCFFNAWKINLPQQPLRYSSIPLCWIGEVTYPTALAFSLVCTIF